MGFETEDSSASAESAGATDVFLGGDPSPRPTNRTLGLEELQAAAPQQVPTEVLDAQAHAGQPLHPPQALLEGEQSDVPAPGVNSAEKACSSLLSYYAQPKVDAGAPCCGKLVAN